MREWTEEHHICNRLFSVGTVCLWPAEKKGAAFTLHKRLQLNPPLLIFCDIHQLNHVENVQQLDLKSDKYVKKKHSVIPVRFIFLVFLVSQPGCCLVAAAFYAARSAWPVNPEEPESLRLKQISLTCSKHSVHLYKAASSLLRQLVNECQTMVMNETVITSSFWRKQQVKCVF